MTDDAASLRVALGRRYVIERELGRGGMATVYLAEDVKHRRPVAVKVLRPELAAAIGSERFLREIDIAARLNHPHIVALYDSGEADGFLYYVMPHIKGESLRARLDREHRLPLDTALTIARQMASALGYAHAQGVIHRDIKPENVLLHEGEAMVTDFGIALAVRAAGGTRLTETGLAIGTPTYMSPEQALGDPALDARSDLFSLACVLYEMLAGEPPHAGPTAQSIMAQRIVDPAPTVRARRGDVPTGVERALKRALAAEPGERYATVDAFVAALSAGPSEPALPSVAVLPFLSMSADPENEYFADGITEDVIAHLSKVRALTVISRTSVMPFKRRERSLPEIAATLGATALLDGSVRRAGDRVRIVAQLIDADTDRHLWAETYDRELTDIFAIQTDVALQIAAALKAELSSDEQSRMQKEPTNDLDAYGYYVKGRHAFNEYTTPALEHAADLFRRAIAIDPTFALAYTTLALAYGELAEVGALAPDVAYRDATKIAQRALDLDPTLSDAHVTMAYLKALWEYDWDAAEAGYRRAIELSPSNADAHDLYGRLCAALGRFDQAISLQERARELDPLVHRLDVATTQLRAGRYDLAAEGVRKALEFGKESPRAYATLAWAHILGGTTEEGLTELEQAVTLASDGYQWLAQLGAAYAMTGRTEQAREILQTLEARARESYVSPYHFAYVFTGLGEADRAIDYLEQAVAARAGAVYGIKGSFLFAPLRSHPRFKALLAKINLS
ncbi:MAG TPA: protein kinase [Gemmatimonadales bacterium]|nr:protein kinase [Gemmatimonadales bacterium]